ncbi:MAG: SEC-C domain-containing protein [Muribaculaceae bacterium]|nr:SEC-C domain-containing protein [Muribaculaceae bacterium]
MLTNAIEKAQKRVEENNFGIRKRLVEYDDVMNAQRTAIYGKRQNALKGERIGTDISNMIYDVAHSIAEMGYDYDAFTMEVRKNLAIDAPFSEEEFRKADRGEIAAKLFDEALATYYRNRDKIAAAAMPYIKEFVEERGVQGVVGVPVTDGRRFFNIRCDLKEAYDNECRPIVKGWEKAVLLQAIDNAWQEHLRDMDELRKSVQNASYEQKDPLVIYKIEAFGLWKNMLEEMNSKAVATLMRGKLAAPDYEEAKAMREAQLAQQQAQAEARAQAQMEAQQAAAARQQALQAHRNAQAATYSRTREIQQEYGAPVGSNPYANYSTTHETYEGERAQRQAAQNVNRQPEEQRQPVKAQPKVGRNDPCPCGSGKKYKNCHGKNMQ